MGEITNASGLAPIINSIMPYFVAITFLFIGLIMSLTFAPKGADAIIKGGQRGINKASQIYRKKAWGATKAIGRAATAPPRGFAQGMKAGGGWKTRGGWASGFKKAMKTATPPSPKQWAPLAKGYVKHGGKAALLGLKKAAGEVWGAALSSKKKGFKKKGQQTAKTGYQFCPTCGEEIAASAKMCVKCGANFE